LPPCVLYQAADFLIALKPAGLNTHAPSPFHGDGLFEILRAWQPDWSSLSIVHRLDKETSGLMVFGRTPLANKSLTEQFAGRLVRKTYSFLSDRDLDSGAVEIRSFIRKKGSQFFSLERGEPSEEAHTVIERVGKHGRYFMFKARPRTGKTHQIRLHAAQLGIPVLGDQTYGGTSHHQLCLHAERLEFAHPATGLEIGFHSAPDFESAISLDLRKALIDPVATTAFRLIHGAADGWPGLFVDKIGGHLLVTSASELHQAQKDLSLQLATVHLSEGVYHKRWLARIAAEKGTALSPALMHGKEAPPEFWIRENGVQYRMSFSEGYSTGLFFDQRENRRRLLNHWVGPDFPLRIGPGSQVLNLFGYTCGFSVCAARSEARVTSIDLSKKYLDWGRANFHANGLDPAGHDFIFGDVFSWIRKLSRREGKFDLILIDPPTFSRSKESGVFQAEKHFSKLVEGVLPMLVKGGLLFCSCNTADYEPGLFLQQVEMAVRKGNRQILKGFYVPQPPDFPITRDEPAYLKTAWFQLD